MKHTIFQLAVLVALPLLSAWQPVSSAERDSRTSAPLQYLPALRGDYFKHDSVAVGRAFHIYVAYPEDYEKNPEARYPVVYLLDGDSLFPIHATYHRLLQLRRRRAASDRRRNRVWIVRPFRQQARLRFLRSGCGCSSEQGGAPAFHRFLKNELIPEIDRRYRTDPDRRVLFGQSRGGYMVLYSAFTDPDLFWGRIASNPSFDPGRALFFPDLQRRPERSGSGRHQRGARWPSLRRDALDWFRAWDGGRYAVASEDGEHRRRYTCRGHHEQLPRRDGLAVRTECQGSQLPTPAR